MSACKSQWRKVLVLLQQMKRQKLLPVAWQIWVARGVMEADSLLNAARPLHFAGRLQLQHSLVCFSCGRAMAACAGFFGKDDGGAGFQGLWGEVLSPFPVFGCFG